MDRMESVEITTTLWKLLATFVFVFINGFFVAAEFALVKIRPSQIEALATKGNRRARLVVGMTRRLDLYLSACQMGITIASLILGWLAEPAVAVLIIEGAAAFGVDIATSAWVHPVALAMALIIITVLHMTIGEQAPKMFSIQKAESTILAVALPLHFFATALKPLIWTINWISNRLVRVAGVSPASEHDYIYDLVELRAILQSAARTGSLTPRQTMLGENVLGLANLEVRHIMVPRMEVAFLSMASSIEDNLKIVKNTGHSRYPLGDPDLDHVVGLILSRTLLGQLLDDKVPDLKAIRRKCPTVPDSQPLSRLILDLQRTQTHCAQVIDEHGTLVGLAFLEDAIEEIVGPIFDEFDERVTRVREISPGVVEILGTVPLPDASSILEMEFDDDADTIGGLVISRFKRIPKKGDSVAIGPYKATATEVSRRCVTKIRFEKTDGTPQ
jgi:CBS domain containing-hemolysin-like protein